MSCHKLCRILGGDRYESYACFLQPWRKYSQVNKFQWAEFEILLLSYCFPSPSLQLGQVHATRRKRGFAGVELLLVEAGVSVVITTSMVVASAWAEAVICPLEFAGADATVTSCVACGVPVVTTCHLVGSFGSCCSCWPSDEAAG